MSKKDFLWDEFIYGGHYASIGVSALILTTMVVLQLPMHWEFLLIVYLLTQSTYAYNRIKEIDIDEETNAPRVEHLRKFGNSLNLIPGFYALLFFTLLIWHGDIISVLFGGAVFFLGLFFTIKGKNFSKIIPGFKSIYIGMSWGCMVLFTAIYCSQIIILPIILFFSFVFIRIMINVSFCDIKDLESDKKIGLTTLFMIFKNRKSSINFLHMLNLFSFTLLIVGVVIDVFQPYVLFLMLSFFITFYYTQKAKNSQENLSSVVYIIADGELYYWPFFMLVGMSIL
jgi:4-hydroxybenzoate polyprenyltransferase